VDRHPQFNMDAAQARHIELVMSPPSPGIVALECTDLPPTGRYAM
jgi:hypothetical protein